MALAVLPRLMVVDADGVPRVAAELYFYQSGTTTPITVYTTPAYSVAHSSPVVSVSNGFFPAVYINPAVNSTFKLVVKDAAHATIWTEDNVPALGFTVSDIGSLLYPRTAAEIAAGVTPTYYYYPPYNLKRYGAVGDGTTDDATAVTNFWACIPTDGEGFIPAASSYYKCSAAITRTNRVSVRGEGLASRIHYTGSGVALTIEDCRFSKFENWYLTGTSSATGGVYVKNAFEGFNTDAFYCDSFTGASAYAMRISDSWTIKMTGGALRQSTNNLICDTTNLGQGGIVNSLHLFGVDLSEFGNIGLDFQSGNLLNCIGCDFSHGGTGAPVAAIEIGRGLTGALFVGATNIVGCWFEGPAAAIRSGRSNTSSATPKDLWTTGNYHGNTGDAIRLYKADRSVIGSSQWGSGTIIIDAGVTNSVVFARGVTVTDNATAGQTGYYQYDQLVINDVTARNNLRIGSGALQTRMLKGSGTVDFASTADAAATSATVTVTGAALGDHVTSVSHTVAVPAGVILQGNVTAADTVTVTLFNKSGGAVDLASGTVTAIVARYA